MPAEDAAAAGKRRRVKSSETPAPANAASSSVGARAVALALICLMCNASSDDPWIAKMEYSRMGAWYMWNCPQRGSCAPGRDSEDSVSKNRPRAYSRFVCSIKGFM